MAKKSKELKVKCVKCGKEPDKNKEKSNENWTAIDLNPCKFCGGKVEIDFSSL